MVQRYRLEVDLTAEPVTSRTDIEFDVEGATDEVVLNAEVASIRSVTIDGVPASFEQRDGLLIVHGPAATNLVSVDAEVAFADDGHGLCEYRADDDPEARYVHAKLFRKGERTAAPRLFACFDNGGAAPIELTVLAPAGWTCVSNAPTVDKPSDGAAGRWRFAATLPTRPAGLVIAAGPWAEVDEPGAPLVCARRSVGDRARRARLGGMVGKCLAWHERALGVPYPFADTAVVLVPQYASLGGGGSRLLLHESLLDDALDRRSRRHVLWAVAHETAHAWLGGVVHAAPDDGWLLEGVATYLCHLAMASLDPEVDAAAGFHVNEEAAALRADGATGVAPLVGADDPSIMYAKPAAALRHLSAIVGQPAVLAGLRLWLERSRFIDSTTADLVRALAEVTGYDVESWADEWVRSAGANTLELRIAEGPAGTVASAEIVQHADVASATLRTHHTGVELYDVSHGRLVARDRVAVVVIGRHTSVDALVGRPVPALAVLNAPPTTYARVRLDDRTRAALAEHLGDLPPATRAVCWTAANGMVQDDVMPAAELAAWIARHGARERDTVMADLLTGRRFRLGLAPGWEAWRAVAPG